jgi:hypothetical protein
MHVFKDFKEQQLALKLLGIFFIFYLSQLFVGGFVVYFVAINQTQSYLQTVIERAKEDISYNNGKWNMQRYNADPYMEDNPTYIVDTNGYVLDRWLPVHGFLDTSDVKHLLSYQKPQTVLSPANQIWRILSVPIIKHGQTIGVTTVAQYNPQNSDLGVIDDRLNSTAQFIQSKITFTSDDSISVQNLDVRDIRYDVSFQVVDRFNNIIAKSNNSNSIDRIPNYVDNSYVGDLLNTSQTRIVKDVVNNESFYLVTSPIYDANHFVIGAIVVGRSISYISDILRSFMLAESGLGFIAFVLLSLIVYKVIDRSLLRFGVHIPTHTFSHISFDKKKSAILIDEDTVAIPYATNQYYLCEALFSSPKKRWEIDELLERFGELDTASWRKVYDAMNIVNKKVSSYIDMKLIVAREKTYQINPSLLGKLS